jgi:hypothetical protein
MTDLIGLAILFGFPAVTAAAMLVVYRLVRGAS